MDSNIRELLYLLSVELIVFYLIGFGFLLVRSDNTVFGGIAYSAVLFTFFMTYLLDVGALLVVGLKREPQTTIAIATGGVIFSTVTFLTLLLLCAMLWSTPLVCIDVSETESRCFRKGDSVRQVGSDVKFSFPSPEKYEEYRELGNASIADLFMKAKISEGDYVTKINAILFVPLIFLIYVLQNSFFYTMSSNQKGFLGLFDLATLFLRCALLVLVVVIDTMDLFSAWNVQDGYLQMIPSLVFIFAFILSEFTYLIRNERLMAITGLVFSILYLIFSFLVALYYAYPNYVADTHSALGLKSVFLLSDVTAGIVDTRPSLIIVLFIFLLIVDTLVVLRGSLKTYVSRPKTARPLQERKTDVIDIIDQTEETEKSNRDSDLKTRFGFDLPSKTREDPSAIDFKIISKKKT
jgi:hypothetical protein